MVLYIDSQETDKAILCATEYVEPLSIHLNREIEPQEQYLSWGILQVFRGVAFLHEAHLIHGSLHAGSVFRKILKSLTVFSGFLTVFR